MGRGSEEELESRDWDGKGSVERGGELGLRGGERETSGAWWAGMRRCLRGWGWEHLYTTSVPFTIPGGRIVRWKDELSSPCVTLTSLNLHFFNYKLG